MIREKLTPENLDKTVERLTEILKTPGSVALVPTETVYGLIARAGDKIAEERIFTLKNRNTSKLLGWFTGDWHQLPDYGVIMDGLPEKLASEYFPGPLTVIAGCVDGSTQ